MLISDCVHRGFVPVQYNLCMSLIAECSFHGDIYSNGDVFSPDDCNRCTCEVRNLKDLVFDLPSCPSLLLACLVQLWHSFVCVCVCVCVFIIQHSRVECNVNPCPSQSCQQPPAPQTTCCPVCQTSTHNASLHTHTYLHLGLHN